MTDAQMINEFATRKCFKTCVVLARTDEGAQIAMNGKGEDMMALIARALYQFSLTSGISLEDLGEVLNTCMEDVIKSEEDEK